MFLSGAIEACNGQLVSAIKQEVMIVSMLPSSGKQKNRDILGGLGQETQKVFAAHGALGRRQEYQGMLGRIQTVMTELLDMYVVN